MIYYRYRLIDETHWLHNTVGAMTKNSRWDGTHVAWDGRRNTSHDVESRHPTREPNIYTQSTQHKILLKSTRPERGCVRPLYVLFIGGATVVPFHQSALVLLNAGGEPLNDLARRHARRAW